jgi:hypothetical protein
LIYSYPGSEVAKKCGASASADLQPAPFHLQPRKRFPVSSHQHFSPPSSTSATRSVESTASLYAVRRQGTPLPSDGSPRAGFVRKRAYLYKYQVRSLEGRY